jgi:hypothetical protein
VQEEEEEEEEEEEAEAEEEGRKAYSKQSDERGGRLARPRNARRRKGKKMCGGGFIQSKCSERGGRCCLPTLGFDLSAFYTYACRV